MFLNPETIISGQIYFMKEKKEIFLTQIPITGHYIFSDLNQFVIIETCSEFWKQGASKNLTVRHFRSNIFLKRKRKTICFSSLYFLCVNTEYCLNFIQPQNISSMQPELCTRRAGFNYISVQIYLMEKKRRYFLTQKTGHFFCSFI